MSKQEIQISSVKLIQGGLKGLEIKYLRLNDVNSIIYKSEMTEKNKRPVNIEMQLKFEEFKSYLSELCSIEEEKTSITGITASHNKFLISGTVEVLDKKKSAINTPCITEEDGYSKWESVQEKVDDLYKMVLEYMEKEAYTATNEQMILQFNKGKEGFDIEAVKNMTEEEQVIEATKLLEKIGCVVMNPNEEDMPGGIEDDNLPLRDISAGDEKDSMFVNETPTVKSEDLVIEESQKEPEIDFEKIKKEEEAKKKQQEIELLAAEKKQKAREQIAKLKEAQEKLESNLDDDDDFIPLRKVG